MLRQRHPRQHDEKHLAFIRQLPCCVCGDNTTTEAAHLRFPDTRAAKRSVGKAEKPDDVWTVPLCGDCHRKQHTMAEEDFWTNTGVDPVFVALALARVTGDAWSGELIIQDALGV